MARSTPRFTTSNQDTFGDGEPNVGNEGYVPTPSLLLFVSPQSPSIHIRQKSIASCSYCSICECHSFTLARPPLNSLKQWSLSLLFHGLDISGWKWLDRYRLHKISEATSRNRTTLRQVIQAVFLQQIIQTGLGWWWLSSEPENDVLVNHTQAIGELAPRVGSVLELLIGPKNAGQLLAMPNFLPFVYWWAIPAGQFALAL